MASWLPKSAVRAIAARTGTAGMRCGVIAVALAAAAGLVAGCGAAPLPPPAEPADAPAAAAAPAGRVIDVGSAPEGIVADAVTRTVAVATRDPDQLVLFDADTGGVTARVPLPKALRHLQLAGPGGPVLAADEGSGSLLRVALPAGPTTSQLMTGINPHDATQTSDGTVFVANEGGASVVAVRADRIVATFTDVTQPGGIAAAGNIVGLVDVRENTLTFYDATTLSRTAELPAGAGPTHAVADRRGRLIVSDTRGGQLLVYEPTPVPRQVAQLALPGDPYGLTYDPVRDLLWVTLTATNQVVGFDLTASTPREVARIPTVRQPNTVAVDPTTGRLFVTGTADGTVQIVDP